MAAGASRRLGSPKQLLPWKKSNLLNHCIRQCLKVDIASIYLIVGANREIVEEQLMSGNYTLLYNKEWEEGMGSSIRTFVQSIDTETYDGVLILVADQPFLTGKLLHAFFETIQVGKKQLIISKYDKGKGPPSYFSYHYFDDLLKLKGDDGAKSIIKKNKDGITFIPFPKGNIDIDREEDVEKWLRKN